MQDRTQLRNIQALRGVAALAVLFAHIHGSEHSLAGGGFLPQQFRIGVTGVDLFFLISGFVMAMVAARTPERPKGALRFAYNRAARIYPLYWLATFALLAVYVARDALLGTETPTGALLPSLLLLPQNELPTLAVGWTLIHEMYFYIVFSIILLAAPNRKILLLTLWGAAIAIATLLGPHGGAWAALAFSPLTFEFLAGAAIFYLVQRTDGRWGAPALGVGVVVTLFLIAAFDDNDWARLDEHGLRALTYGPPFALVVYGAAALERRKKLTAPRWLTATGDASYALYLFHLPIVIILNKGVETLIGDKGLLDNLLLIVSCAGVSMIAALIIHRFVERPMLDQTRKLGDRLIKPLRPPVRAERAW